MGAQHSAVAIADRIILLSLEEGSPVTPMQVQKLTYFCHAWMLGLGYGPLFQDAVESWQYGPVIRSVYHALKKHGGNRIAEPILDAPATFTAEEDRIISVIWRQYGKLDGIRLSRMTHAVNSPWDLTCKKDKRSQIIHNHLIRDYYAALIERKRAE